MWSDLAGGEGHCYVVINFSRLLPEVREHHDCITDRRATSQPAVKPANLLITAPPYCTGVSGCKDRQSVPGWKTSAASREPALLCYSVVNPTTGKTGECPDCCGAIRRITGLVASNLSKSPEKSLRLGQHNRCRRISGSNLLFPCGGYSGQNSTLCPAAPQRAMGFMGLLLGCLLGDGSVSDLLGPAASDTPDHTNRIRVRGKQS